jgi:hypothetical protein
MQFGRGQRETARAGLGTCLPGFAKRPPAVEPEEVEPGLSLLLAQRVRDPVFAGFQFQPRSMPRFVAVIRPLNASCASWFGITRRGVAGEGIETAQNKNS